MKLYEVTNNLKQLEDLLESGEVTQEQIADTLESLEGAFKDKAEGVVRIIRNKEAEAEALKTESKRLKDKANAAEKKVSSLMYYLDQNMTANELDELHTGVFDLAYRKNPPSVEVDDLKVLPKAYKKSKVTVTPDKTAIKKAFQDGQEVPGARYIDNKRTLNIK